MKIERNGEWFELTYFELMNAHSEYEKENLACDIRDRADEMEIELDDTAIEKAIAIAQRTIGNDDYFWDQYWQDIEYAIKEAK